MWQLFDRMIHGKVSPASAFIKMAGVPLPIILAAIWAKTGGAMTSLASGGWPPGRGQYSPVLERRVASRPVDGASLDPSACMHDVL